MEIWFGSGHNRQIRKLRKLGKLGELRAVPARFVDSSGGFAADRGAMVSAGPALPPPRGGGGRDGAGGGEGGGAANNGPGFGQLHASGGRKRQAVCPAALQEMIMPMHA